MEEVLLQEGWEEVHSLGCLDFHRHKQLFLSAYVDGMKISRRKVSIAPIPLINQVYLGCTQRESTTKASYVRKSREDKNPLRKLIKRKYWATKKPKEFVY